MRKIVGREEFERFQKGKKLKPLDAILAQCYVCNGKEEGGRDCYCMRCPLYQYMPCKGLRMKRTK